MGSPFGVARFRLVHEVPELAEIVNLALWTLGVLARTLGRTDRAQELFTAGARAACRIADVGRSHDSQDNMNRRACMRPKVRIELGLALRTLLESIVPPRVPDGRPLAFAVDFRRRRSSHRPFEIPAPAMSILGKKIGNIRIREVLGEGGMGTVYAGFDERRPPPSREGRTSRVRSDQRLFPILRYRRFASESSSASSWGRRRPASPRAAARVGLRFIQRVRVGSQEASTRF